jgi:hypothetical protein
LFFVLLLLSLPSRSIRIARHAPRKRGIKYAAAARFNRKCSAILIAGFRG